jgi:hypothetical protein
VCVEIKKTNVEHGSVDDIDEGYVETSHAEDVGHPDEHERGVSQQAHVQHGRQRGFE